MVSMKEVNTTVGGCFRKIRSVLQHMGGRYTGLQDDGSRGFCELIPRDKKVKRSYCNSV